MTEPLPDDARRPDPPLAGTEVETLLGFLEYQRATLAWKCSGLTDEQLHAHLAPTAITLGGLLMHLSRVEDYWFGAVAAAGPTLKPWAGMEWAAEWELSLTQSGAALHRQWSERVDHSRAIVAARLSESPDALSRTYPAWNGEGSASLRWVITHMIEEYARHNGHADLLRESIDGATGE
jgi:uncharacterized damage-inducible protein DinB